MPGTVVDARCPPVGSEGTQLHFQLAIAHLVHVAPVTLAYAMRHVIFIVADPRDRARALGHTLGPWACGWRACAELLHKQRTPAFASGSGGRPIAS